MRKRRWWCLFCLGICAGSGSAVHGVEVFVSSTIVEFLFLMIYRGGSREREADGVK